MRGLKSVIVLVVLAHSFAMGSVLDDSDIDQVFLSEEVVPRSDAMTAEPDGPTPNATEVPYQYVAPENYFVSAGNHYGVDPRLLWCIAKVESGLNPYARNKNKNGTYDIGMMQINTVHLPTLSNYGITEQMLYDTRTNIYVGAWVLSKCIAKHGMTKNGITCYNGRIKDNPYADKVLNAFYRQESKVALR